MGIFYPRLFYILPYKFDIFKQINNLVNKKAQNRVQEEEKDEDCELEDKSWMNNEEHVGLTQLEAAK